jgi:hypothetical protein
MVDLPLPDSPTSPSTSPRRISKLTSSTAFTGALSDWNQVHRLRTVTSGSDTGSATDFPPRGIACSNFCVYGCWALRKMSSRITGLHDATLLHHHDLVGDIRDHGEIVTDQQHADIALLLQCGPAARESAPVSLHRAR